LNDRRDLLGMLAEEVIELLGRLESSNAAGADAESYVYFFYRALVYKCQGQKETFSKKIVFFRLVP